MRTNVLKFWSKKTLRDYSFMSLFLQMACATWLFLPCDSLQSFRVSHWLCSENENCLWSEITFPQWHGVGHVHEAWTHLLLALFVSKTTVLSLSLCLDSDEVFSGGSFLLELCYCTETHPSKGGSCFSPHEPTALCLPRVPSFCLCPGQRWSSHHHLAVPPQKPNRKVKQCVLWR